MRGQRISSVDVLKIMFIATGIGMVMYGYFWPGLLLAGIGAAIAWAQHEDSES